MNTFDQAYQSMANSLQALLSPIGCNFMTCFITIILLHTLSGLFHSLYIGCTILLCQMWRHRHWFVWERPDYTLRSDAETKYDASSLPRCDKLMSGPSKRWMTMCFPSKGNVFGFIHEVFIGVCMIFIQMQ